MARIKDKYKNEVHKLLVEEFKYKNTMQVPQLKKIVVNMGVGEALRNPKLIDSAEKELAAITGQKPVVKKAKKDIATFKLRKGAQIACAVTLHGNKMYEFFDRLVNIALPKVKDFRGLSPKSFDGNGNYTIGIREHIIFPEINYDKVEKILGMNITIVTSAKTDAESLSLLKHLGVPFRTK